MTETAAQQPATCGHEEPDLMLTCDLPAGHDGWHADYGITF